MSEPFIQDDDPIIISEDENRNAARRVANILSVFFNRQMDYFTLISPMLSYWLIIFKADGKLFTKWRVILIPLLIPLLIVNIMLLLYTYLSWKYPNYSHSVEFKNSFWKSVITIEKRRKLKYLIIFLLDVSFLLFMIRMNESLDGIAVAPILIPLIIICLILIFTLVRVDRTDILTVYDRVIFSMINVLLIFQFISLIIKIDGDNDSTWSLVLLPTWILCAFTVIVPLLSSLFCNIEIIRNSILFKNKRKSIIFFSLFWIVILLPLLACLVMIVMKLDDVGPDRSWIKVSAPFIFIQCIVILACIIVDIKSPTVNENPQ